MDNHFFLNVGMPPHLPFDQPEIPTWHSLTSMDFDLQFPPPITQSSDCFFDSSSDLTSLVSSPASASTSNNHTFLITELIGKLCNSSPPQNNRATMENFNNHLGNSIPVPPLGSNLPPMPGDPGFVERAARFSSFGSRSFNAAAESPTRFAGGAKLQRVCSSPSINGNELNPNPRKRKGKCRDIPCSSPAKLQRNSGKTEEEEEDEQSGEQKAPEAPKDYIHVRARRGQATDSHSLAERVRREKISERMKLLQDLVPGCNKVTGKALMLEEIINYVQSLQGQVEFLSMKLASVNPDNHYQQQAIEAKCWMGPMSHDLQLPTIDGFNNGVPELCEGDLHTIVQMGSNQAPAMKTEF